MSERARRPPPAATASLPASADDAPLHADDAAATTVGGAESDGADGWWLYLLECRNGAYYAGISNDVSARYAAHLTGRGARYTRANPPLRLLGSRAYPDRASAARAEWQLKQLPRARKLDWLLHD
jgi:putative endonuclease